jgi:hypothetical protein
MAAVMTHNWLDLRSNPHVPLSHAIHWKASEQMEFDAWLSAWKLLREAIARERKPLRVCSIGDTGREWLPGAAFDGITVEFWQSPGPGLPQQKSKWIESFVRLNPRFGDQYVRHRVGVVWSGLHVVSAELLREWPPTRPPAFNPTSAATFVKARFEENSNLTLDEVRAAGRGRGGRAILDRAYKNERESRTGQPVKRGPRQSIPQE